MVLCSPIATVQNGKNNACRSLNEELCGKLMNAIVMHKEYYHSFATEHVIVGMGNYIFKKDYNTSTCDVAVAGICNAINTSIIVYQAKADGTCMEIHYPPGHPSTASTHNIYLVGQDAGSHYSALIQAADESERVNPDFVNLTLHFSPELLKPHPKAAPRKQRKNQTRRRKTAILTDTPEKQALEKESQIEELKKRKSVAGCRKKASTRKSNKTKRRIEMEFKPDNTEVFCLVCMEAYSKSKPGEQRTQCMDCGNWSHFECTGGSTNEKHYICDNCMSD